MNATNFDFSITSPSAVGPARQVALEMSMGGRPGAHSDAKALSRVSARRFVPYVQDPPAALDEAAPSALI